MGLQQRTVRSIAALAAMLCAYTAQAGSVQFFGNGTNDIDRIKIRIDPQVPADVGGGNSSFTIEFWMKGALADNTTTNTIGCGNTYGWINGRTLFDRDRHSQPRAYGIAVGGNGRLAFGANVGGDSETICGNLNVLDGAWHHVAFTRTNVGQMKIFVDGTQDAVTNQGPVGDISYPDNATPANQCGPNSNQPCTNDPFIVLGAEKHDAGAAFPSYSGLMDELRISNADLSNGGATVPVPTQPFIGNELTTVALYHFDETSGTAISDVKGTSPGELRFGGQPAGPQFSPETPFGQAGAGRVQFSQQQYFVGEGDGTLAAVVQRVGGSTGIASVMCRTADASAQQPGDYTSVDVTLSWLAGDATEKLCNVPIVADATAEGTETFQLQLHNESGAALGNPSTSIVNITESSTAGTLRLQQSSFVVNEDIGTFNVTVTRTNGSVGAVSVTVSTQDGSAIAGSDYTAATTVLQWADGETVAKTTTIALSNDATQEAAETFTVALSNVAGGASIGAPSSATVTINASDAPSSGGGGGGGGGAVDWVFLLGALLGIAGLGQRSSQRRQRRDELKQLEVLSARAV